MFNNILPSFSSITIESWSKYFPNSIGSSIFSSPAWQKIMEIDADGIWTLKLLSGADSNNEKKNIPFLVQRDRWGRFNIIGQPFAYHLTPVENGEIDEQLVKSILSNVCTPFTTKFLWALPPWLSWQPSSYVRKTWAGIEKVTTRETYVISITDCTNAEDYLVKHVNSTSRRYTRQNFKKELEVIAEPSPELINEYYKLYSRIHAERGWVGKKHTLEFFNLVAKTLNDAGELIIMKYNNKIVGGGILLYDQYAVHYFQGTIDREIKGVRPMHALLYRAIQQAIERKLKYINLGGVNEDNSGLDNFKRSWGADTIKTSVISWESRLTRSNIFKI